MEGSLREALRYFGLGSDEIAKLKTKKELADKLESLDNDPKKTAKSEGIS
jgi:hypothetical protein